MSKSANRLGKGLGALIGPRVANTPFRANTPEATKEPNKQPAAVAKPIAEHDGALRDIAIDLIRANPRQPRTHFSESAISDLAASIRTSGILQPLLLRAVGDAFELVAGERRFRAAKQAGLKQVPALVKELTDAESLEIALVENLQREDLGPLDRANAYQHYVESFGTTPEFLATRLGESRATVVNHLRLLRLPAEIQDLIRSGQLSMGQARAILGSTDPQRQIQLGRLAVRRNLSVRQLEELVKSPAGTESGASEKPAADKHQQDVETALSKAIGLSVALKPGKSKNSGTILIRYNNLDEFDRVAERLSGRKSLE